MVRLNLSSGDPISLELSPNRKFRGPRIPGSALLKADRQGYALTVHFYDHPLYAVSLRQYLFKEATRIVTTEQHDWFRLEIPLGGSLSVINQQGISSVILPGYYQATAEAVFASDLLAGQPVIYFTAAFSPQLLSALGSGHLLVPVPPSPVPRDLIEMVYEILKCPFQEAIRDFYYANKVRELLFSHIVSLPMTAPGELNAQQVAAMYEADRIMADNLDGRITIPELARRLGTNFVTLKRNYEKVFGVGIFPRLMQRKMDHIKLLLEKTDKPLKEIADLAGYQTLPGFINAFRKRFRVTPKEWRKARRGH